MREEVYGPGGRFGCGSDASGMHGGEGRLKAAQCPGFAERTENMPAMVVTLEVSQLEMFALKLKS